MGITLPSMHLTKLLLSGKLQVYDKGETIQTTEASKSLHMIDEGYVKRYFITNEGTLGVQSIYGKYGIFPLTAIFRNLLEYELYEGPETFYYGAMDRVKVYSIDIKELREAIEEDPLIYKELLIVAGVRLESFIQRLENLALHSANKKVAHQLAYYGRKFGRRTAAGTKIDMPLSQQDLADVLSLTRETVSMAISDLRKRKLLKSWQPILIQDLDILIEEAHS